MSDNKPAPAGGASVRIGDTVAVICTDRIIRGRVIHVGMSMSLSSFVDFGSGLPRPSYRYRGGWVATCVDEAGWSFAASIGWTHPDRTVSIRRGVVER